MEIYVATSIVQQLLNLAEKVRILTDGFNIRGDNIANKKILTADRQFYFTTKNPDKFWWLHADSINDKQYILSCGFTRDHNPALVLLLVKVIEKQK